MGIPTRQSRLVSNFEGLACLLAPRGSPTGPSPKKTCFFFESGPVGPNSSRSEARPTDGDQAASSPPGILRKTLTVRTTLQVYSLIHSLTHSLHPKSTGAGSRPRGTTETLALRKETDRSAIGYSLQCVRIRMYEIQSMILCVVFNFSRYKSFVTKA